MCTVWAARLIHATARRRMLGSFVHGSMANALPQAIGAQLPERGRQVIAMCGDGGLAMLMGDFLTLLQHDLPVKVVIFDNGSLGMVALEMLVAGYPPYQTGLKNPDFAAVARAAGATGIRIEDSGDVGDGLHEALEADGPVLVDVLTDPNALSMPPKIRACRPITWPGGVPLTSVYPGWNVQVIERRVLTGEQVKGFALAMSRLVLSGDADEVVNMARSNLRNLPRP
jgi:pyruvate dehydrogenase (quinone)